MKLRTQNLLFKKQKSRLEQIIINIKAAEWSLVLTPFFAAVDCNQEVFDVTKLFCSKAAASNENGLSIKLAIIKGITQTVKSVM